MQTHKQHIIDLQLIDHVISSFVFTNKKSHKNQDLIFRF
jgi:hypothetical protein